MRKILKKIKIFILKLLIGEFDYFVITNALNCTMLEYYEKYKNAGNQKILMLGPTNCVLKGLEETLKSIGGEIEHEEIIKEFGVEYESINVK